MTFSLAATRMAVYKVLGNSFCQQMDVALVGVLAPDVFAGAVPVTVGSHAHFIDKMFVIKCVVVLQHHI